MGDDWSDEEITKPVKKTKPSDDDWGDETSSTQLGSAHGNNQTGSSGRGGLSGRGRSNSNGAPRGDDWICGSCSKSNYSTRRECFGCKEPKDGAIGGKNENGEARPPREPRKGDWNCLSCSKMNYANRDECFSCHEGKGDAVGLPGPEGGEKPAREPRKGDWNCLSCSKTNFSNRTECFSCNEDKGDAVGLPGPEGGDKPPREPRRGDWNCLGCSKMNYGNRSECFSCNEEKGNAVGLEVGPDGNQLPDEKPREVYVPPAPTEDENEMYGNGISAGINFDQLVNIEVAVSGRGAESIMPVAAFKDIGLRDLLLENVKKSGYTKPTPIQKHAIPIILAQRDLMGCAQTGSGKTAAFVLPIINRILDDNDGDTGKPQCLIVAPTRELAIQIYEEARKFAHRSWIKVAIVYGGTASRNQGENVARGCHILVATPGRLMDFVNKSIITFECLKFLVLDEADRMLDMGFKEKIEEVVTHSSYDKSKVQTLMFSATFPEDIQRLAAVFLRDYLFLVVGIIGGASTDVDQEIIEVTKFKKRAKLGDILKTYIDNSEEDRILVFVETKKMADFLASFMSETKISSTSIHGDRLQSERELALREFRTGKRKVLVATSVAARGLDIKGVTHVINYDLPKEIQDYVHRIGRTGRVGNRGKATSFYDPENDGNLAADLVRILKEAKQPVPEFLGDYEGEAVGNNGFGGLDIRKGVKAGNAQEMEEDW